MTSRPGSGCGRRPHLRRERALQLLRRLEHLLALVAPEAAEQRRQLHHPRPAEARLLREIRPREEGFARRGQHHRQRPAAAPGHALAERHEKVVDGRQFLTVDLHRDEVLVHQARHVVVLEALALHHVAPVAGGVADRDEERHVTRARRREGLLAPGVPVDRVAGVREQVRALLAGEPVRRCHGYGWTLMCRTAGYCASASTMLRSEMRCSEAMVMR